MSASTSPAPGALQSVAAGTAVLVPGGKRRMAKWVGAKPRPLVQRSVDQLGRYMADMDRRYPRPK